MAVQTRRVPLDYCSFYIAGNRDFDVVITEVRPVMDMGDYIFVEGRPWNEGETRISLGWIHELKLSTEPPRFDGMLDTPHGYVELSDANYPTILAAQVPDKRTRIRIWTNRHAEPDRIIVALG